MNTVLSNPAASNAIRTVQLVALLVFMTLIATGPDVHADELVIVKTPFLEVRTGPGRGFPVFHVLEQRQQFVLHKQHTDWLKISTLDRRPKTGWVHVSDLDNVGTVEGADIAIGGNGKQSLLSRRLGWSMTGGDFNGASAISTVLSFRMTQNLHVLAEIGQVFGHSSNATRYGLSLRHEPFPSWRLSPYFQLGTGQIDTRPFATLIAAQDRSDQMSSVGGGMKFYLTRQFTMHVDFTQHQVLTSRDTNEEINEWKLGFSVAF